VKQGCLFRGLPRGLWPTKGGQGYVGMGGKKIIAQISEGEPLPINWLTVTGSLLMWLGLSLIAYAEAMLNSAITTLRKQGRHRAR
jgi:hypothetical protein